MVFYLRLLWSPIWGHYRAILGIYGDNGKENGSSRDYRVILYFIWGYYGAHYRVKLYPPFWGIVFYRRNISYSNEL